MNKQTIMPTIGLMFSLTALSSSAMAHNQPKHAAIMFSSPNQHIACYGRLVADIQEGSWVECNIHEGKIKRPLQSRPKSCTFGSWGDSFILYKNKNAKLYCYTGFPGDAENDVGTLKVGQAVQGDGWQCTGLNNGGVNCKNKKGNYFSINHENQFIFNHSK